VLRRLDAERAHRLGSRTLALIGALPGAEALLRRALAPRDPVLRVRALGIDFPGPLGLAAGFDKDAEHVGTLGALGFGFVEVGTVTSEAQPGNARPRLFRLPTDRALVNRMGFNNGGAAAAAVRLRARRRGEGVVGVNVGKLKVVTADGAVSDFCRAAEQLAPFADYLVVNVSSPNTPGLRALQAVEHLRELVAAVGPAADAAAGRHVPLLVKIAPDLADSDVDAIADLAVEQGLDGIIATNTTTSRDGLASDVDAVAAAGDGGLSGAPLRDRSVEILRRLRARVGDRVVLISVGGVETPDDVWQRLLDGATLVQGYTGFIYGGPLWAYAMHRSLARRARAAGLESLAELSRANPRAPAPSR
jgi:dihydroorotate dehydrogenase